MKTFSSMFGIAALTLALTGTAPGEDSVAGKWKAEFDTQIGMQKYTFDFQVEGDKLTGTALGEREMGTNEVTITEGKIDKDQISFVEPLKFEDNEIRIEYKGKLSGDEIKFTRKVGDVATEELVAKRVKESAAAPDTKREATPPAKPDTKAAPAKP
jgi:hypothetical protein